MVKQISGISEGGNRKLLWSIIILSAVVKLFFLEPLRLFEGHDIAHELMESGEFRYFMYGDYNYNYQFPVYPTLLFLLYSIGFGVYGALVLNVLLGSLSAYLCYRISVRINKSKKLVQILAMLTALVVAFHPFLTYYQVKIVHPFALDLFLGLLLLFLALTVDPRNRKQLLVFGLIGGLTMLNRPTLIMFAIPFVFRYSWKEQLAMFKKTLFPLGLLFLLPTLLWLGRNYSIYDEITLNSSQGQNLWIGIQEETQGTTQMSNGENYLSILTQEERDYLHDANPMQESEFFTEKYKQELADDSMLWMEMMLVKFKNFWFFRSDLGIDHGGKINSPVKLIFRLYSFVLFVFAFSSILLKWRIANSLLLAVVLLSLVQAIFYVETRHKLLIDPVLITLSLIFLGNVLSRNMEKIQQ